MRDRGQKGAMMDIGCAMIKEVGRGQGKDWYHEE